MEANQLPFSQYRLVGNLVFLSGQIGLKEGVLTGNTIEEQLTQAIENVRLALKEIWPNSTLANVVDVTAYLLYPQHDYLAMNAAYAKAFEGVAFFPTLVCVGVTALRLGARVELKVIAQL